MDVTTNISKNIFCVITVHIDPFNFSINSINNELSVEFYAFVVQTQLVFYACFGRSRDIRCGICQGFNKIWTQFWCDSNELMPQYL